MKLTSEEVKKSYQERTARPARAGCPSADVLLQAATGTLRRSGRQRLVDHLLSCSDCAREYQLARSLGPWAQEVATSSSEPRPEPAFTEKPPSRSARPVWRLLSTSGWPAAAAAAAVLFAVGGSVLLWRTTHPPGGTVMSERASRSPAIKVEPTHLAMLREPPERLAWSAVEAADGYRVVLYDRESTPIWESPVVTSSVVPLPETVRKGLPHAQPIFWRVVSHHGVERRQSPVFQFVISP